MSVCRHPVGQLVLPFPARDYVTDDRFEVCRCTGCGLDVTSPQPAGPELAAYYPAEYYRKVGARRFPMLVERAQQLLYQWRARRIEQMLGVRSGRVLDIGCGPGALLEAFRHRGWEAHGTELSEVSAARAREAGFPVHVGPFESWPWPAGYFDAVVMWHVLEHWPNPYPIIRQVQLLLRSGGLFMVGVPNFGSPEARIWRDKWFHLDVPRHLVHFTPQSLSAVLSSSGFVVTRRSFFAPEFDTFSFMQSALNGLGLKRNSLYNLLRGHGAKLRDSSESLHAVASLLLALPLGILSLPTTALLGQARQGSALTLWAVKEH